MRIPCFFVCLIAAAWAAQAACPSWADRFIIYGINGDQIIDQRTGLIWKRCSEGQTWDSVANNCNGSVMLYKHTDALSAAKNFNTAGSSTGWRLPNVKELFNLVDRGCWNPSIDSAAFPGTFNGQYWTSSSSEDASAQAFAVFFSDGASTGLGTYIPGHLGAVRLVRSTQ